MFNVFIYHYYKFLILDVIINCCFVNSRKRLQHLPTKSELSETFSMLKARMVPLDPSMRVTPPSKCLL